MCSSNVAYRRSGISSLTHVSTALERVILRNKRRQVHTGPGSMRSMFETPLWRSAVSPTCLCARAPHAYVRTHVCVHAHNIYIYIYIWAHRGWLDARENFSRFPDAGNQRVCCMERADSSQPALSLSLSLTLSLCLFLSKRTRHTTHKPARAAWWKILLSCLAIRVRVSISE